MQYATSYAKNVLIITDLKVYLTMGSNTSLLIMYLNQLHSIPIPRLFRWSQSLYKLKSWLPSLETKSQKQGMYKQTFSAQIFFNKLLKPRTLYAVLLYIVRIGKTG